MYRTDSTFSANDYGWIFNQWHVVEPNDTI